MCTELMLSTMLMHCDTVDAKHLPLGLELFRGLAQHVHVLLRACATACVMSSFTFDVSGSVREHVRPMSACTPHV